MATYTRDDRLQSTGGRDEDMIIIDQGVNQQLGQTMGYNQHQIQQPMPSLFGTGAGQYQYQNQQQVNNDDLIQNVPPGYMGIESLHQLQQNSQGTIDIVWSKSLKGRENISRQDLINGQNNNIQGFISKENPRKQLVYANNVLRVIDIGQSSGSILFEVPYKDKDLVYSSFKGDYLITNYIEPKTQQSILEVKRLSSKDHQVKQFSSDLNNQLQQQQIQLSYDKTYDYISCELVSGTSVTKVHVYQHYGQIGIDRIEQQQFMNADKLREILIILRRNSNVIELREIKHNENQIVNLNMIEFQEFTQNGIAMKIEDFKIIDDRLIINFENTYIYFLGIQDLLNQTGIEFNTGQCQRLERFNIFNQENQYKIASIDQFIFQQQPLLIISKESQNPELAHQLEFYNFDYIQNIKMLDLIPTFISNIEHTQEYQEYLNLDRANNSNYLNRGGSMLMSAFSPQDVILKGQTRKILDTLSTDFAFFILAKEGRSIVLYMIDRYSSDIIIQQVNQGQLLKGDNKIVDDLIGARIMMESIDQQPDGVQVDIILLSNHGTQVSQLRINQPNSKMIQSCSQLDRQTLKNIPRSTQITQQQINGINANLFDQNDPLVKMQFKVQSSLDLVHQLLGLSQYKKLSEYVLMKVNERDENYIFEEIGALQIIMQGKIDQQRVEDTAQLLSAAKHYQYNYDPNFSQQVQFKKNLEQDICIQILRLEGYQTVFSAIVKREQETMKSNQIKTGQTLESNRLNIERIQRYVVEKLEKQTNFMKLLLFLVQSEYLPTIYQLQIEFHDQLRKISMDLQQEDYPMTELEQYISVFDQQVLPQKPLTLIYYHILELQQLKQTNDYQFPDLKPYFQLHLSHILSSQTQKEIEALWTLDHLELQHLFANQQQICSELIACLLRGRKFAELDHLVLRKLLSVGQERYALEFVSQGGCCLPEQLNDENTLNIVIQLFLRQNKYLQALTYLKQNENTINSDLYQNQLQQLVEVLIKNNRIEKGLFNQSLSLKQREIIESYIQLNHPSLLLSLNIFQRDQINGLAKDLTLPQQQQQPISQSNLPSSQINLQSLRANKANDLKQLLHVNYLASMGNEKCQAVFQSTQQPQSQIEYMLSEKQSQYSTHMKFNPSGNAGRSSLFGLANTGDNNGGRVVPTPQISYKSSYGTRLYELKNKFMSDPFFSAQNVQNVQQQNQKKQGNGLMDFFRKDKQEESKIMGNGNNIQNQNVLGKSLKIVKGFGMLNTIDQPYVYKEDINSRDAIGILPTQIRDYNIQYQENLRQSISPDRSHLRSSIAKSSRSRQSPSRIANQYNQIRTGGGDEQVFIPTEPDLMQHTLGTHDDLLRDTGDLENELMNKNSLLMMQNDYEEDDIAVVPGMMTQGTDNRMTAGFGQGAGQGGDHDISNISRDQRSAMLGKNLSTIQESMGESYMSGGGQVDYNASYMSHLIKSSSHGAQQKLPQRYSMDQRSSALAASGNNPFGSSVGSKVDVNMRSGGGLGGGNAGDSQSLNLQKSELLYQDDEDLQQHVGNLKFQDDDEEEEDQEQEVQEYDDEEEDDDANYPNESPEQKRERQENKMLKKQVEDVIHQKGYKTVVLANRKLTRSEAKKINMQPDEHIELTPAHKK